MGIARLNHAVLYVRDAVKSAQFYSDALGFKIKMQMGDQAVFMLAPDSDNDHDLGLFSIGDGAGDSAAGKTAVGLYHLAWQVDTLNELQRLAVQLSEMGALIGATDHTATKSLYARDIDGLEFEVMWRVPVELLTEDELTDMAKLRRLDLEKEIERFGGDLVTPDLLRAASS